MTRTLLSLIALTIVFLTSCQKENSEVGRTGGDSRLVDKLYAIGIAVTTVNGQVTSREDTVWSHSFSYDNLSRVTSIESLGLAGDSTIGFRLFVKYHYTGDDRKPWLITSSREGDPNGHRGLDSVFYIYNGEFVYSDSTIHLEGNSSITTCEPTASGFLISRHYRRDYGYLDNGPASATSSFINGNMQESVVVGGWYREYFRASYLNSPNPFYGMVPRYPVKLGTLSVPFDDQPQLISELFSDENDSHPLKYNYTLRSDGYPVGLEFEDTGDWYKYIYTYR